MRGWAGIPSGWGIVVYIATGGNIGCGTDSRSWGVWSRQGSEAASQYSNRDSNRSSIVGVVGLPLGMLRFVGSVVYHVSVDEGTATTTANALSSTRLVT